MSVNAQVRIGSNAEPNASAVLDLNATDATNNNSLGLALPRVSLSSLTAKIHGTDTPPEGMLVYNTTVTPGVGVYCWKGGTNGAWEKIENTAYSADDTTLSMNSTTFSVKDGGITAAKLNRMGASSGQVLRYTGTAWAPATLNTSGGGGVFFTSARRLLPPGVMVLLFSWECLITQMVHPVMLPKM